MQQRLTPVRKAVFILGGIVLSMVVCAISGELLARLFWKQQLPSTADEKTLSYHYDPELGWYPIANSKGRFTGSREISFQHNQDGFRDRSHGPKIKPRIAFVGDSYVWGYDAEADERFTDKLQRLIPDWEVFNLGISGYATDQELLLARRWFEVYRPDLVVLVFSDNDTLENTLNSVHGGYYKPYFEPEGDRLVLKGSPAPKGLQYYRMQHPWLAKSHLVQLLVYGILKKRHPSHVSTVNPTLPLILQLKSYSETRGGRFVLAYVDEFNADKKRAFAEKTKLDYLFLLDAPHLTTEYFYPSQGNHWKPKGHDFACSRLYAFLTTNQFLQTHPLTGSDQKTGAGDR
jgi:hypothetical protein